MFCKECGRYLGDKTVCPYCGYGKIDEYAFLKTAKSWHDEKNEISEKSRTTAGVLQFFAGGAGIGRFYIGDKKTALMQIILSVVTLGLGGFLWGIIDSIGIFSGKPLYDGSGKSII